MSADDDGKKCRGEDFLTLGPVVGDAGQRPYVRHRSDHTIEPGFIRPAKEGEPLSKDAFYLRKRGEGNEYGIEPIFESGPSTSKGPAKVTTDAFRSGWDNIFGAKASVGQA